MPYIKQEERERFDPHIGDTLRSLTHRLGRQYTPGELNYIISSIVWALFDETPSYTKGNELVGVLECVKQEFIRRKLNPYEEEKIKENGDI